MKILNVAFCYEKIGGGVKAGLIYGDYLANEIKTTNAMMETENQEKLLKDLNLRNPITVLPKETTFLNSFKFLPIPNKYFNIFRTTNFKRLNIESFDLVHMHNPVPIFAIKKMANICQNNDIPYVLTCHSSQNLFNILTDNEKSGVSLNPLYKSFYKIIFFSNYIDILKNAKALFTLSESDIEMLKDFVPNQEFYITSNGVKIEEYEISDSYLSKVKKNYDLEDDLPIILFVGSICKRKSPNTLLEAIKRVKADFQSIFVGPPLNEKLVAKLKKFSNQNENIKYLSYLPRKDLVSLFMIADIFVLPSLSETFGMVVIEAMAGKTPCIVSDITGPNEIIENGKTGYLFPKGDSESLQNQLKFLLENEELRTKMGKKAFKEVKKRYIWEKVVEKNILIYKKII